MIRSVDIDDWMMLVNVVSRPLRSTGKLRSHKISQVVYGITCSLVTYLASIGGFRHMFYLPPPEQLRAVKWNWIALVFGILLFATGKIAVALLIIRILSPSSDWRKKVLYGIIILAVIFNTLGAILGFVQCSPPRALWTPNFPSSCWDPRVQSDYAILMSST